MTPAATSSFRSSAIEATSPHENDILLQKEKRSRNEIFEGEELKGQGSERKSRDRDGDEVSERNKA